MQLVTYMREVHGNWYLRSEVDWTKVFVWAVPSNEWAHVYPISGEGVKPVDYRWPILRVWHENKNQGSHSLIKASSFWSAAQGFGYMDEALRIESAESFLRKNLSGDLIEADPRVLSATIKLLDLLSSARIQDVQCLKLKNQVDAGLANNDSQYAEAVVNIFNRLNASGVSLKHEEMVFAWIKTAWMQLQIRPIEHSSIISEIVNAFNYKNLDESQIIKALNVIWIVAGGENGAALFSHQDILNGARIREMSGWMARNWRGIEQCFKDLSWLLNKYKVKYGSHYKSMNLLYISLAYLFVKRSVQGIGPAAPENGGFMDHVGNDLFKFWYLSLFSGRWAKNSDADILHYARRLKFINNNAIQLPGVANNFNDEVLSEDGWVKRTAKSYIEKFDAEESYATNAPLLFLWTLSKA